MRGYSSIKAAWLLAAALASGNALAQQVDYSVVSVSEETGIEFTKVTKPGDYVAMPEVRRSNKGLNWFSNRTLAVSPDGQTLAYLSARNKTTNIFLKDVGRQGSSTQRTNRTSVIDFSYSPDGKKIVFSEASGRVNQVYITDASTGYVCRQITTGNLDYTPVFSPDMKQVVFCRSEQRGSSVWGYNLENNFLLSYCSGMNPCPVKGGKEIVAARVNAEGRGEIWKINYGTGVEECLISDPVHSFTSPIISPDGRWLLMVGDGQINMLGGGKYFNTDIFASRIDGTQLTQLTYHAADDICPVWSADGQYIYFISQRGDSEAIANIWRMDFNLE